MNVFGMMKIVPKTDSSFVILDPVATTLPITGPWGLEMET